MLYSSDQFFRAVSSRGGFESILSSEQNEVFEGLLDYIFTYSEKREPFKIVSGYAGTGKTFLISVLVQTLTALRLSPMVGSFTGRAASNIALAIAKNSIVPSPIDRPRTLHSLLYFAEPYTDKYGNNLVTYRSIYDDPRERMHFYENNPFPVLIVDESSMVSETLLAEIMKYNMPVIFFGDNEQLGPIEGDGQSIMDRPDFMLKTIHRQAENSPIIRLSREVRETGKLNKRKYQNEIEFIKRHDVTTNYIAEKGPSMMICGTNHRRDRLNTLYRTAMGYTRIAMTRPVHGETIMPLKNTFNPLTGTFSYNGELITVENVTEGPDGVLFISGSNAMNQAVSFNTANDIWNSYESVKASPPKINDFQLTPMAYGYACTTHKAQGSEFDKVLVYNEDVSYFTNQRKALYTAITRAKKELIIAA